ncbi:MAG: cell division protein ZipA [Pseudomonadota bacterium]
MDGLRWLLLLFGAVVIVGVYFYSRREKNKPAKQSQAKEALDVDSPRIAPTFGDESLDEPLLVDKPSISVDEIDVADDEPEPSPASSQQKIVTLRIVARDKGAFKGDELILSLRGIGMRSGKFGIYHRYDGNDESRTIFSAASLVEPGSFDLENIKEQEIPGISLFMVVPGPLDGAESFDMLMEAARALAKAMDGELLDETGSTLSIQRERYMREEIIQFQHSPTAG